MKGKRLFFDIETSPNIGLFWSAGYKQRIDYDNITVERKIICICYKWGGQKKVYSLTWDNKKQCDKKLLKAFIEVANTADELVGHNGDRYDLAFIRTRCAIHELPMFPNYITIDTLKIAKNKFRFNSNRLDYIGQVLGLGKKIKTEYSLWKDIVLKRCEQSLKKMVVYCKQDVNLLESVYNRLSSHYPHKTHFGVHRGRTKSSCPHCESYNTKFVNRRVTAAGSKRVQLQCNDCGKYHTIAEKDYTVKYINNDEE
jgi:RNase P subunit RPR2